MRTITDDDRAVVREEDGVRWHRCLRCDAWIPLPPPAEPARERIPPREEIELPLRGRAMRDLIVLRLIAIDRFIHFVVLGLLALAVLLFVPNTVQLPVPLPQAILVAAAFTALMAVLEFIDHHSHTAIGLWLTLIASLVAAYGAFELGGRLAMPSRPASS